MVADLPRCRRMPHHVVVVLVIYAVTLVAGGVALTMWLGSDDVDLFGDTELVGDIELPDNIPLVGDIELPGDLPLFGDADETISQGATGQPSAAAPEAGTDTPVRDRPGWSLVWHDEFRGPRCPDPAKWSFEHGFVRNHELQWYQPSNALCDSGVLDIRARREEAPRPSPFFSPGSGNWRTSRESIEYTSASLISKRSFTYGRFEMRGRIDTRAGSWPAFWTLGVESPWPRGGEVDILEYYRGNVLANVCKPRRTRCGWSSTRLPLADLGGEKWASKFHVWTMEWSPRRIDLFVDLTLVNRFRVSRAVDAGEPNPYVKEPQSVLLSQAIGGANGGDPSGTEFPVRLEVDYVRVYRRAG